MKKWFIAAMVFVFVLPISAQDMESKVTIRDVLKMSVIAGFDISPDGSWIVYSQGGREHWDGSRNYNLWLLSIDGSKKRKITNSEKSDWSPKWSPDGSQIAFHSNRSGRVQIHIIAPDGGEAKQVTYNSQSVNRFTWMNNSRIATISSEPRDSLIVAAEEEAGGGYVVGTQAHTSALWTQSIVHKTDNKKITDGSYYIRDMVYATDGKKFALVTAEDSDLYNQITASRITVIDLEGKTLFTFQDGRDFGNPAFSPDNRKIAFVGTTVGFSARNALFVSDLKKQTTENITELFDPTIQDVHWLDNRTLTFLTLRRTYTGIYRIPAKGGEVRSLLAPHFAMFSYSIHPKNNNLVFFGSHGHHPSGFYIHQLEDPPEKAQVVLSPNAWLEEKELASSEVIRYLSFDGAEIEAVLTLPPRYDAGRKYGLMVMPHGGPDGMDLDNFSIFGQIFAQEGLIVFRTNFRGSIGFGSEFYRANRGKLGDIDYKDIMAGVDYLTDKGMIDTTKMVVGGWSYGGYMTNWIIGHTDRFRAAVSVAGVSHNASRYGQGDINHSDVARWEYLGVPVLNMENYTRSSPIYFLSGCKTPTLIMHGEEDVRVPVGQAWELYRALNDVGVHVQMVLYPNAGHGISAPKQYADVMTRWVNWYNHYLSASSERMDK